MRTLLTLGVLTGLVFIGAPHLYTVSTKNSQNVIKPEFPENTISGNIEGVTFSGLKTSRTEHLGVSGENTGAVSVFTLQNPDRAVIDLFGENVKRSYTLPVNSNNITRVRIGKHDNKTRVVLDLQDNSLDTLQFSSNTNTVELKF